MAICFPLLVVVLCLLDVAACCEYGVVSFGGINSVVVSFSLV